MFPWFYHSISLFFNPHPKVFILYFTNFPKGVDNSITCCNFSTLLSTHFSTLQLVVLLLGSGCPVPNAPARWHRIYSSFESLSKSPILPFKSVTSFWDDHLHFFFLSMLSTYLRPYALPPNLSPLVFSWHYLGIFITIILSV